MKKQKNNVMKWKMILGTGLIVVPIMLGLIFTADLTKSVLRNMQEVNFGGLIRFSVYTSMAAFTELMLEGLSIAAGVMLIKKNKVSTEIKVMLVIFAVLATVFQILLLTM